jgi:hypothetical protein
MISGLTHGFFETLFKLPPALFLGLHAVLHCGQVRFYRGGARFMVAPGFDKRCFRLCYRGFAAVSALLCGSPFLFALFFA